ncbi:M48 family metallopeptidase [Candidatus Woesearchaeota archaeon]|nr:M48 family metallopeptidase [Candidatus Woesearchaeota archaeon]
MGMVEEAFRGIWPDREIKYDFSIKYSGKFKGYNANVKMAGGKIMFSLSRNWKQISKDIKIGLLQELLARLFNEKITTPNIDLYHIFLKKVHIAVPKTKTEPMLEESFGRVNEKFFAGIIEQPNLKWNNSSTKLGSYDYGSDTITISSMLKNADSEMIDYVMYHEILHKKHKFSSKNGRLHYHTREFRSSEKSFPNSAVIEEKLKHLKPARSQAKKKFRFFKFF